MGGRPTACVVNLGVRSRIVSARMLDQIYEGLRNGPRAEQRPTSSGGNITSARQLTITIALLGEAGPRVMRRDGARVGR